MDNITEKNISKIITKDITDMVKLFKDSRFEIYAVGGCVRDILMGREPHDLDFCTSATPDEMEELFIRHSIRYFPLGKKYGTMTAVIGDKEIEITTYRKESSFDGRHCCVQFSETLTDDLSRRDFTVNAIAFDILSSKVIDPFGGINDIKKCILRTVGDPGVRFKEDTLRVLRAFRFAVRFGFIIEPETYAAVTEFIDRNLIGNLSGERIQKELVEILSDENLSSKDMELIRPLLFLLIPELKAEYKYDQNSKYHCYDLWTHTYKTVILAGQGKYIFPNINLAHVRIAALLHDVGKPKCRTVDKEGYAHYIGHQKISTKITAEVLKKLKFPKRDIEFISKLILYHDSQCSGDSIKSVRKLANKVGREKIESLFVLKIADVKNHNMQYTTNLYINTIKAVNTYKQLLKADAVDLESSHLAVNGNDIMQWCNIQPSPRVGNILTLLKEAVDNGAVENCSNSLRKYLLKIDSL